MFADYPNAASAEAAPVEPPPLPRIWRGGDVVIGSALVALAYAGVTAAVFQSAPLNDFEFVLWTGLFELSFGASVLLLARMRGLGLRELGFVRPSRWQPLSQAWLGSYGVLIAYGIIVTLIARLGVDTSSFEGGNPIPTARGDALFYLVGLGFTVVVLAPFSEELFFRALVYRGLSGVWPRAVALGVSGLAFGLFHLNLAVALPFTAIGVLFAWANDRSRSLWTSIIAHALVNGLSFALTVSGMGQV